MPTFSRRTLVQTAALVPFQAVRGTSQNSAVKIGLIGAGSRGTYTARIVAKTIVGRAAYRDIPFFERIRKREHRAQGCGRGHCRVIWNVQLGPPKRQMPL